MNPETNPLKRYLESFEKKYKSNNKDNKCQKVYVKHHPDIDKNTGDICGEPTLGNKFCILHHFTESKMMKNVE
jgi:hypothetical protein